MGVGNCRAGPGMGGEGRDGPARKEGCRGCRIEAPPPASDQTPSTSKSAFSYGSESLAGSQAVEGAGAGFTAGRRSRRARGTFRGTVHFEYCASPARKAFFLNLLFGSGPPPDAAAGGGVRELRRPRLPAAGDAAAVGRQPEEVAL